MPHLAHIFSLRQLSGIVPDEHSLVVEGSTADYREPLTFGAHEHEDGQLIYAATGIIVVGSVQGYWVAPPTRALWLPPGAKHWTRTSGNVQLRSVLLKTPPHALLPAKSCVLNVSPLLREVIAALAGRPEGTPMSDRDFALTALLIDELDEVPVLPLHLPSLQDGRLVRIERHVLREPDRYVSLAEWAGRLHINQRTLQRAFVRETGMPYRRWLQQAQLLLALEWLADGRRVIDVAADLGYSSQSAFTFMFKRNLGMPPGAFFANDVE
ncbi:helix-turn-helix transcriptional regulator [Caballeronia sp. LZ043]|nr:helix-turn-helix transcriptional regulator [Caballeronia sp. LZ043]